jgi:CHAT domain-containing protein
LPGTVAEVIKIQERFHSHKQIFTWLNAEQATIGAVTEVMESHNWIHLACHGIQDQAEPTKSAFALYDGRLDLETISSRTIFDSSDSTSPMVLSLDQGKKNKQKSLAFLSACQTATGSEQLPEEAVHIAAGMLMAGYTTVLATMWSISDKYAPMVAEDIYRRLMAEDESCLRTHEGQAAYALHYAIGRLREVVGESNFMTWVPFIHLGV